MVNDLIDLAIKNILRQKTRTILTVVGIVIGIAAVIALGSISEGMNAMMNQEMQFLGGTIMVSGQGSSSIMFGSGDSAISKYDLQNFEDFSGVKQVVPYIMKMGQIQIGQGSPVEIIGIKPEDADYFKSKGTNLDSGRAIETGDTYQALIGYKYAEDNGLGIGDSVEVKKDSYEVVGIIEKTDTNMDNSIILPLETMMNTYGTENYQSAFIIPEDLSKIQDLADDMKSSFDDFSFTTSNDIIKQMSRIIDMIRFFTIGISSIAAIVGGLGVMNTMIMSVLERKREIGIMKAIGATRKYILTEILLESVIISLIGGIIGLLIGGVGSYSLRYVSSGLTEAKVTIQLAVGGLSFAVFLGLIGGFYPAWSAAKLDPIEAIRYE
jgi:putative ABC transport system permease protein